MRSIAILTLPALLATAAAAQTPAAAPDDAAGKPICRRIAETGTRFSKRVCRTAAQWKVEDQRLLNSEGFAGAGGSLRQQGSSAFGPAGR